MTKIRSRLRGGLLFAAAVALGVIAFAVYARRLADPPQQTWSEGAPTSASPAASPGMGASLHGARGHHPAPRRGAGVEKVVDSEQYDRYPRIASIYEAAAQNPELLDGLHCYCNCAEHARHYSLLECFSSDHAAMCDICLNEAETAFQMSRNGADLEVIRTWIDGMYGG
jgi:hypothetical protein